MTNVFATQGCVVYSIQVSSSKSKVLVILLVIDMRKLTVVLTILILMDSTVSQYPDCVECSDGE